MKRIITNSRTTVKCFLNKTLTFFIWRLAITALYLSYQTETSNVMKFALQLLEKEFKSKSKSYKSLEAIENKSQGSHNMLDRLERELADLSKAIELISENQK